ncbi:MAG: putative CxxxxCH...CXXCH cytochrome family protein [Planctomycetota bacterium]|jgi:predicted CxxxxCH...CXXCH cytochrome family protein
MSVLDLSSKQLIVAAFVTPIVLLGALSFRDSEPAKNSPPSAVVVPEAVVAPLATVDLPPWSALFIGPARGKLEPCGCSGGQLGGIDRLSSMLSFAAPPDGQQALRIAAGGVVASDAQAHPSWAKAQLETLWQSFGMMSMDMVGLAETDLVLMDEMTGVKMLLGAVPVVATNLLIEGTELGSANSAGEAPFFQRSFQPTGGPQFFSFLPKTAKAQSTSGSGEDAKSINWIALDAVQALMALQATGTFDPSIPSVVLFEGTDADHDALGTFLGASATLLRVNDDYEASHALKRAEGKSASAALGTRLRYVVRLDSRETGLTFNLNTVTEDVPGDPVLASMRGLYRMMLEVYGARDAVADSKGEAGFGGFAGSSACATCHADAYEIWEESLHYVAMEALVDDLRDGSPATNDPNCIYCHSVGYGYVSGYGSAKLSDEARWGALDDFAGVGCESCHGPGAQHVLTAAPEHIDLGGEYTCLKCHDSENDPTFHFGRKWPDIEHNNE